MSVSPGLHLGGCILFSPWTPGHTHWFNSRSRVKLELKAGMTKLTWARWTGWGKGGKADGESTWGGLEVGTGGPGKPGYRQQPWGGDGPALAAVGTTGLEGRCFPPSSSSFTTLSFPEVEGQAWASLGTDLPALWVPAHALWCRCLPGASLQEQQGRAKAAQPAHCLTPDPPCCWQGHPHVD